MLRLDALVFSKDRPAQLDLLLRSIELNAGGIFNSIRVIWTASSPEYVRGYQTCQKENIDVLFYPESDFRENVMMQLSYCRDLVCLFCDDDIFYRDVSELDPPPHHILEWEPDVFCHTFRLGRNTIYCYPLESEQSLPKFIPPLDDDALTWDWRDGDLDWGYPASVDGTIFRSEQLYVLLSYRIFINPNQMEDVMMRAALERDDTPALAACYRRSRVVNTPVNIVNVTHPNRAADHHPLAVGDMIMQYNEGHRLTLDMDFSAVNAAHCELSLVFV